MEHTKRDESDVLVYEETISVEAVWRLHLLGIGLTDANPQAVWHRGPFSQYETTAPSCSSANHGLSESQDL